MPAPLPPEDGLASLANEVVFDENSNLTLTDFTGSKYEPEEKLKPIIFSRKQLNDRVRDLALSEEKAELVALRLQENNLLQKDMFVITGNTILICRQYSE